MVVADAIRMFRREIAGSEPEETEGPDPLERCRLLVVMVVRFVFLVVAADVSGSEDDGDDDNVEEEEKDGRGEVATDREHDGRSRFFHKVTVTLFSSSSSLLSVLQT